MSSMILNPETGGFSENAVSLAAMFRCGRSVEATLQLTELLPRIVEKVGEHESGMQEVLKETLCSMLEAQQRQDWLGLADELEYELVEILRLSSL